MFRCEKCGCVHKEAPKDGFCLGCSEQEGFEEIRELTVEDVVNIIRDYPWSKEGKENPCKDSVDYYELKSYIEKFTGEEADSLMDEALKISEGKNIAVKRVIVFYPD